MDGMNLIERAHDAGLEIHRDGERIVIRGPKDSGETARLILANKSAVIENFCFECGLFIDRAGTEWAIIHSRPIHLHCYRTGHRDAGQAM